MRLGRNLASKRYEALNARLRLDEQLRRAERNGSRLSGHFHEGRAPLAVAKQPLRRSWPEVKADLRSCRGCRRRDRPQRED
jgi:hypothetical protein